ncbi:hypothetical protein [Arthrobacter sp. MMS18-M83]|uniref:hypothetical protein n=1 Tax=Arthrobacter sp. MMS18-M83 TaxID=2996261 RepID=UPI00227D3863|nr:hypothetical protein [Arthrobacter sp. MMS18-M83]WAH97248.1 hypothetical protein OW521_23390 [Arthrobacter sp. MMS18-M83]
MKKSSPKGFFFYMRLTFVAICSFALASLLVHQQAVSAAGRGEHIHSLATAGLAAAEVSGGPSASLQAGAAPNGQSDKGSPAHVPSPPSGQSPGGPPIGPPADGERAAANSKQRSLGDAAAEPNGLGLHTGASNPAPVPRGTVAPSQVLDTASQSLGGCLKEYGDAGQCLPVVPPSLTGHLQQMKDAGLDPASMPHNWSCVEVRLYFPHGLAVREKGVDPQHLDSNGDGIACGAPD